MGKKGVNPFAKFSKDKEDKEGKGKKPVFEKGKKPVFAEGGAVRMRGTGAATKGCGTSSKMG